MNMILPSGELRINGKKIKTDKVLSSINPSTEEIFGEYCVASEKEVNMAVKAAREASKSWKLTPLEHRLSYIKKFRNLALEKMDELAHILAIENGRPYYSGLLIGAGMGCVVIPKYYELFAGEFLKDEENPSPFPFKLLFQMRKSYTVYAPMGVIGIICPWDYPIFVAMGNIVPCLAAGNTVVLKPSRLSTFSTHKIYDLFEEIGLPAGVLNIVTGPGEETGEALTRAKVDKILFTGSSETAPKILENCTKNLTPAYLGLGGVDVMIILKDADLEEVVNGAIYGVFSGAGQSGAAPRRILVAREIKEEFLRKVLNRVKKLKMGNPLEIDTDIGPMISKERLELFEHFVKDAVSKGAKVECGGKRKEGKGYFYEPTILTNVSLDMRQTYEERFGPLMSILEFESEEEAIAMANYPRYALASSIWSKDIKRAQGIARQMASGTVEINDAATFAVYSPWGGVKKSGYGKSFARDGLRAVTYQKTVEVVGLRQRFRTHWFPYNAHAGRAFFNLIKFTFQEGIKGKMGQLFSSLKNLSGQYKEYKKFIKE